MSDERDEVWVNVRFEGAGLREFQEVQAHLGISTRTEVIRHLVHKMAEELKARATVTQPRSAEEQG